MPPLPKPDESLMHRPKEKAALFAGMLDSKQSNGTITLLHLCFPEAELTFAFHSGEIKKLILEFHPFVLGLLAFFLCFSLKLPII